ncbi:aldehyde ferredoxin oxidoreductase family protein [Chloroflexota bacterium]
MSHCYGFVGTNLYIDLSSGNIRKEPLDKELTRNFIGGFGIGSRLLYNLVPPGIDPLSPENRLIFATGPLIGTFAPAAARVHALAKSPMSGLMGTSNGGHSVGIMLKYAGYDNLIISGRAERPVYLKVFDDDVEIRDASHLWGKDTWQTTDLLREELGTCSVSCIGPAGENLVRFANILNDKRSGFNKTGLGAVMGAKNLKAVVARGTKGVVVADRKRFQKLVDEILTCIAASPLTVDWRQYGTAAKGSQGGSFDREEFRQRVYKRYYACQACPVACKCLISLQGGDYAGLTFNISALNSLASHHSIAKVENWDELAKCVEMENRYGVDGAAMAGIVNLMAQLNEKGIFTTADTSGLTLTWGGETIRKLIPLITSKEGIGALLAEGAKVAAEKIGRGAERYANHMKGVQREPAPSTILSTTMFGRATNPRGGHGDRSVAPFDLVGVTPDFLREYSLGIGVPEGNLDRLLHGPGGYNVPRLTKWAEDFNSVLLSMGICFRDPILKEMNLETLAALYEAATGIIITPATLLKAGERIWNLQKTFNIRHGWTRKDDLPNTWSPDIPIIIEGESYGTFNQMLDEYYDERGWDMKTGIPSVEKLREVGLDELCRASREQRKRSPKQAT